MDRPLLSVIMPSANARMSLMLPLHQEMDASLRARAADGTRLIVVFQPHRYSRTRDCFEDFVKVIGQADAVLLAEVYAAGEAPIVAADGRALTRALRVAGKVEPVFVDDIAAMPQAVLDNARDGDVVLCMGAGSIGAVAGQVVELANKALSIDAKNQDALVVLATEDAAFERRHCFCALGRIGRSVARAAPVGRLACEAVQVPQRAAHLVQQRVALRRIGSGVGLALRHPRSQALLGHRQFDEGDVDIARHPAAQHLPIGHADAPEGRCSLQGRGQAEPGQRERELGAEHHADCPCTAWTAAVRLYERQMNSSGVVHAGFMRRSANAHARFSGGSRQGDAMTLSSTNALECLS